MNRPGFRFSDATSDSSTVSLSRLGVAAQGESHGSVIGAPPEGLWAERFGRSGFGALDAEQLKQFGSAFEAGMDPLEVGAKVLAGMRENRGLILTHPEFAEDFREIYETCIAALPDEEAPPERLEIERLRREANRAALAGAPISIDDLT